MIIVRAVYKNLYKSAYSTPAPGLGHGSGQAPLVLSEVGLEKSLEITLYAD